MKKVITILGSLIVAANALGSTPLVFSPYADITMNTTWDPETQSMEPMDLAKIAAENSLQAYHLAFITDSGSCQPAWGAQVDYSVSNQWAKRLTDHLAQNGIDVAVSFGGASGTDISFNCNQEQLLGIFEQVMKTYQAKTLDFDIENGTADVPKLMQALRVFQQKNPKIKLSFTLPVMPEGLTFQGQQALLEAKKAELNYQVNIMAMDYGPAYSDNMGRYAITATTALHDYLQTLYPEKNAEALWQQIIVTPMIGVNDVNTEQFTLANADELRQFAQSKKLGGLAMWSIARDKPCADKWASPICSGNNLQTKDYEFVKHFLNTTPKQS
ncbi:chitinase [Legionella cardiaca]|uniref:Chitinase n=1 Tax=Legionella cardiaca TaxID=1071983 RepID=A0ABY8ARI6_9GAMM|nr:chitinase [Legionella cardiaca]WED43275.1 chitinase [Legionella cardiaca]